eukprot:362216-Chlamydomonas_euryale.AAC.2
MHSRLCDHSVARSCCSYRSMYRDLCPLLGVDPSTARRVAKAVAAAAAAAEDAGGGALDSFGSSDDDQDEDSSTDGSTAARQMSRTAVRAAGQPATSGLGAADDFAELLETTVHELRHAPLQREHAAQLLGAFLAELAPPRERACAASSLATVAWALSHTRHKRRFVKARSEQLLRIAALAGDRYVPRHAAPAIPPPNAIFRCVLPYACQCQALSRAT